MIKCILTDMDGTILNSKGQLSSYTKNVITKLLNSDIQLAVASGRFFPSIHDIFKEFNREIIYTCNNGTWIENSSRTKIYHKSILTKQEMLNIISLIKSKTDYGYLICTSDYAVTDAHYPYIEEAFKISDSVLTIIDNLANITDEITKVTVCILEGIDDLSKSLESELGDSYEILISGDIWLDVIKKGASKANAFPILHEELGIKPEEMLIFGDYDNDIAMLEMSPNSFAMADASSGAKNAANFVIGKNDDHAVAKKIEELTGL